MDYAESFYNFYKLATHFSIGYNGGDFIYRWDGEKFGAVPYNPTETEMYSNLFPREDFLKEAKKANDFLKASGKKNYGWHFTSYIKTDDKYQGLS